MRLYEYKKGLRVVIRNLSFVLFIKAILISLTACGALIAPYNEKGWVKSFVD